jgi:Tfp pilus assembly protein PilF
MGPSFPEEVNDLTQITVWLVQKGYPQEIPSERIEEARRLLKEAKDYLERAVRLAPKEPQVYLSRIFAAWGDFAMQALLRPEQIQSYYRTLVLTVLPDIQRAARLTPNDSYAIGSIGLAEVIYHLVQGRLSTQSFKAWWEELPEESRRVVLQSIERLKPYAQSDEPHVAAGASEMLGILLFIARDEQQAEVALRRTLALDPSRKQAWEMLTLILFTGGRWPDIAALYEKRLQFEDTVYFRFILAKVYEVLGQVARGEEHLRRALRMNPDDVRVQLGLAAILLKYHEEAEALEEAGHWLKRAGQRLESSTDRSLRSNHALNLGIYLALTGDTEGARRQLQQALEYDADNQSAREALAALGAEP